MSSFLSILTAPPPPPRPPGQPPTHEEILERVIECEAHVDRATRVAVASVVASLMGAAPDSIFGRLLSILELFLG